MSYGDAASVLASGQDVSDSPDRCVWQVTLEGRFYEPPGPAGIAATPGTSCGRIDVILPENGGQYSDLTFRVADGC
jgi:hypothetical protein